MESMGDRLKRLRLEHNFTQEYVGNFLGVQKAAINKYENGNVENIKRSSIQKLATLYGVKPSYILCLDEDNVNVQQPTFEISPSEQLLIEAYRKHPEMQLAINKMLDIHENTISDDIVNELNKGVPKLTPTNTK